MNRNALCLLVVVIGMLPGSVSTGQTTTQAVEPETANGAAIRGLVAKLSADDYQAMARRILSKLRVDYGQAGPDPSFDALIEEMNEISPMFRELWRSPEITGHSEGVHPERHPTLGVITFAHSSYVVEGFPTLRVVIYAPYDAESASKLDQLARETRAAAMS